MAVSSGLSEHSGIYRYQRVGRHAVRQEIRGFFREAAEAWQNAARLAPCEAWRDFALKRASACRKRKLTAVCSHQTRIGNLDAHLI
ncbi:ANR family transcriptional regulator [Salmonella enterica]|nr:ANR family transcriptional regulator [Salmonella enterica]